MLYWSEAHLPLSEQHGPLMICMFSCFFNSKLLFVLSLRTESILFIFLFRGWHCHLSLEVYPTPANCSTQFFLMKTEDRGPSLLCIVSSSFSYILLNSIASAHLLQILLGLGLSFSVNGGYELERMKKRAYAVSWNVIGKNE